MKLPLEIYFCVKSLVVLSFAISFSAAVCAAEGHSKKYQGSWAVDCSKSTSLTFGAGSSAILTVNQNQIYIKLAYKEVAGDAAELFYVEPDELGLGGSQINWGVISTSERVGTFRVVGDKKAIFSWFGFFDVKAKKHILVRQAEFATDKNEIILVRCD